MSTLVKAHQLYDVYKSGYSPPKWVLKPKIYNGLAFNKSIVYYDNKDHLDLVKMTALIREPVNITMEKKYSVDKMHKYFGWKEGIYGFLSTDSKLAPNIAIYNYTPVILPTNGQYIGQVHLINLIGYAFDNIKQPDAIYFKNKGIDHLIEAYSYIWNKAFICAQDHGLKAIHIAMVGGGAFSPVNDYEKTIYRPSVDMVKVKYPNIKIIEKFYPDFIIPTSLTEYSSQQLNETLFVNAWDPWSMVGNGNTMDNSLDGYWGRSTASAVLSWPHTNPYISYRSI